MSTPPREDPPLGGDRIAKVLARRGIASRRMAEEMIAAGRVSVNGKVIDSPAMNVRPKDRIEVDGKPVAEAAPARLWLYHKPLGLVTTEKDEKGRPTVFASLPPELGRVMSVGRLDLNSEGLLLLTNDGELKRRLELPSTGWLRKYRVRVNGAPTDASLEPLRRGVTAGDERFQPMEVTLDRQQGANAWLTVGLREGRNREVRRAVEEIGLTVNRLIRVSYGPFRLGQLKPGEVEEVRQKVLRDQLGLAGAAGAEDGAGKPGKRSARAGTAPGKPGRPAGGILGRARRPGTQEPRKTNMTGVSRRAAGETGRGADAGAAEGPGHRRRAGAQKGDSAAAAPRGRSAAAPEKGRGRGQRQNHGAASSAPPGKASGRRSANPQDKGADRPARQGGKGGPAVAAGKRPAPATGRAAEGGPWGGPGGEPRGGPRGGPKGKPQGDASRNPRKPSGPGRGKDGAGGGTGRSGPPRGPRKG